MSSNTQTRGQNKTRNILIALGAVTFLALGCIVAGVFFVGANGASAHEVRYVANPTRAKQLSATYKKALKSAAKSKGTASSYTLADLNGDSDPELLVLTPTSKGTRFTAWTAPTTTSTGTLEKALQQFAPQQASKVDSASAPLQIGELVAKVKLSLDKLQEEGAQGVAAVSPESKQAGVLVPGAGGTADGDYLVVEGGELKLAQQPVTSPGQNGGEKSDENSDQAGDGESKENSKGDGKTDESEVQTAPLPWAAADDPQILDRLVADASKDTPKPALSSLAAIWAYQLQNWQKLELPLQLHGKYTEITSERAHFTEEPRVEILDINGDGYPELGLNGDVEAIGAAAGQDDGAIIIGEYVLSYDPAANTVYIAQPLMRMTWEWYAVGAERPGWGLVPEGVRGVIGSSVSPERSYKLGKLEGGAIVQTDTATGTLNIDGPDVTDKEWASQPGANKLELAEAGAELLKLQGIMVPLKPVLAALPVDGVGKAAAASEQPDPVPEQKSKQPSTEEIIEQKRQEAESQGKVLFCGAVSEANDDQIAAMQGEENFNPGNPRLQTLIKSATPITIDAAVGGTVGQVPGQAPSYRTLTFDLLGFSDDEQRAKLAHALGKNVCITFNQGVTRSDSSLPRGVPLVYNFEVVYTY